RARRCTGRRWTPPARSPGSACSTPTPAWAPWGASWPPGGRRSRPSNSTPKPRGRPRGAHRRVTACSRGGSRRGWARPCPRGAASHAAPPARTPPGGGVDAEVRAGLAPGGVQRIVYGSCDPATLPRDVARLAGTYGVRRVRCFDLFPQTAHVETLVELEAAPA